MCHQKMKQVSKISAYARYIDRERRANNNDVTFVVCCGQLVCRTQVLPNVNLAGQFIETRQQEVLTSTPGLQR